MTLMQGLQILDVARRVISGEVNDPKQLARLLVGLSLDLAPVDELKEYLTDASRVRDDRIADALEAAKVGL